MPISLTFEPFLRLNFEKTEAAPEQIELALRENAEEYRTLTENITIGVFRSTPGLKGKFLEVNRASVRMILYRKKSEMLARSVSEIYLCPNDKMRLSQLLADSILECIGRFSEMAETNPLAPF